MTQPVAGRYEPQRDVQRVPALVPARDRLMGAPVSLLLLPAPATLLARLEALRRLRRLAESHAPGLARTRGVGEDDGRLYAALAPLGDGRPVLLAELGQGRPPSARLLQQVGAVVLEALDALHGEGLVHGEVDAGAVALVGDEPRRVGADRVAPLGSGTRSPADAVLVVLLPASAAPQEREPGPPDPAREDAAGPSPAGDVQAAVALLLTAARHVPRSGPDADLADALVDVLLRAGAAAAPVDPAGLRAQLLALVPGERGRAAPAAAVPAPVPTPTPTPAREPVTAAAPTTTAAPAATTTAAPSPATAAGPTAAAAPAPAATPAPAAAPVAVAGTVAAASGHLAAGGAAGGVAAVGPAAGTASDHLSEGGPAGGIAPVTGRTESAAAPERAESARVAGAAPDGASGQPAEYPTWWLPQAPRATERGSRWRRYATAAAAVAVVGGLVVAAVGWRAAERSTSQLPAVTLPTSLPTGLPAAPSSPVASEQVPPPAPVAGAPSSGAPAAAATPSSPAGSSRAVPLGPEVPPRPRATAPDRGPRVRPAASVDGLVRQLRRDPAVAGAGGPRLLDALQDLRGRDARDRQDAALRLLPLLTEARDLDPRWATAARRAAFQALTSGSGRDGGCLRVVRGKPAGEQRAQARRLVGQLPVWVAQGFPAADAVELQAAVVPIAQGRARLDASRCR